MTFFYTHVAKRKDSILLRAINKETGKRIQQEIPFKPCLFMKATNGVTADAHTIKGEALAKIDFETITDMRNFLDGYKHMGVYLSLIHI